MKGTNEMELKELQDKFLEYVKAHPLFDVVDDFENDVDFDEKGEPLFDVERVLREMDGRIIFDLKKIFVIDSVEEDELDKWMRGFLDYVGINGSLTPLQHETLNDSGADYDVEVWCHLT